MLTHREAEQRSHWEALCPGLSITEGAYDPGATEVAPLRPPEEAMAAALSRLKIDGYLQLPPLLSPAEVEAMAAAVEAVTGACGSPVFALVYDAFWALPWRLSGALAAILGGAPQLLPDCWVWKVNASPNDAGWSPHRDRDHGTIDDDGTPQIISLWLPLTDATPENGCIYALPAFRDPHYHTTNPEGRSTIQQLQHVRALPADAGAVLCWTHQLLHWGGASSAFAPHPRISVAFELQRQGLKPFSKPLFALDALPGFVERLGLIGRMLLQYQKMHPIAPALRKLAKQLRRHMPGKRSFADVLAGLGKR